MASVYPGRSFPLGAKLVRYKNRRLVNFSVYSGGATSVDLLFFDRAEDSQPARVIPLDPAINRTFHYWHVFVPGVKAGQVYAYRARGPFHPEVGCALTGARCCSTLTGAGSCSLPGMTGALPAAERG